MIRKIFNLCTLLSLLMCACCVWWWTSRSPASIDQISFHQNSKEAVDIWASNGKLMFTKTIRSVPDQTDAKQLTWGSASADSTGKAMVRPTGAMNWMAVSYTTEPLATNSGGGAETTVVVPAWLLVATFGMLPLLWIIRRIRREMAIRKLVS